MGTTSRAALVLLHMLVHNTPCKERMLHIPLEDSQHSKDEFLLPRCVRFLQVPCHRKKHTPPHHLVVS